MNTKAFRAWWAQRPPREQNLLLLSSILVGVALIWLVALAPAIKTLRLYEPKRLELETQLQTMQRLASQAKALKAVSKISMAESTLALQNLTLKSLGPQSQIVFLGGNASVTLRAVPAETLALWLAAARAEAHSLPIQARLTQTAGAWSGTVQMSLPPP